MSYFYKIRFPADVSGNSLFLGRVVFLSLLLSPLYLWRSGYPQISDVILLFGIMIMGVQCLFAHRLPLDKSYVLILGLGALTTVINLVYYIFYLDPRLFFSSLYYIYNALAFIVIAHLFSRAPLYAYNITYFYIIATVALEIACVLLFPQYSSYRFVGTFNNPNQLAFWSLFTCCTLMMLKIYKRFNWIDYVLIVALIYLQTLSLSKAGLICSILFLLALPFSPVMGKIERFMTAFLASILIIFSIFSLSVVEERAVSFEAVGRSFDRLKNIGEEGDDSAQGRGYYRILEYPGYLLIGAGEGAYFRFNDMAKPNEIHSALGNMLFSYGVLGFFLFFLFLYSVAKKTHPFFLILLFLVLLNGLTHQNIRFTHMWIFVGVAYGMRHLNPGRRESYINHYYNDSASKFRQIPDSAQPTH